MGTVGLLSRFSALRFAAHCCTCPTVIWYPDSSRPVSSSARFSVKLRVVREDFRGSEELSNVTAFTAGPSLHEDCLAEQVFVDDVRGGAKTVSKRWVDTDKGNADRPNCRSRLVVRKIKMAMKRSDVPSAAELFRKV